jgi:hypothetical protein
LSSYLGLYYGRYVHMLCILGAWGAELELKWLTFFTFWHKMTRSTNLFFLCGFRPGPPPLPSFDVFNTRKIRDLLKVAYPNKVTPFVPSFDRYPGIWWKVDSFVRWVWLARAGLTGLASSIGDQISTSMKVSFTPMLSLSFDRCTRRLLGSTDAKRLSRLCQQSQ